MYTMYDRALKLAALAHEGQKRSNGEPYIEHPIRVASNFEDEFLRTIAILHDALEDATEFFNNQIVPKFSDNIIEAVKLISRKKDETYFDFILRIHSNNNVGAIAVKIADLNDNLRDIQESSRADKYRFAKYILMYH